jgi:uncharacterized protein (UPF0261 family)
MKGWLNVETESSDYFEPESIRAFVEALRERLKPEVEIREVDANIDTVEFGQALLAAFREVTGA